MSQLDNLNIRPYEQATGAQKAVTKVFQNPQLAMQIMRSNGEAEHWIRLFT